MHSCTHQPILRSLTLILIAASVTGCANVSIRNYKPEAMKENERTIVGTVEVLNEVTGKPLSDCKITFVLPNGKDYRRYYLQREDKGVIVTWAETGSIMVHNVACGDGTFGVKLAEHNYRFDTDPSSPITYFGHIQIKGHFSGMSSASGAVALGALGAAIAGATQTNELKELSVEDRWSTTEPTFRELVPSLAKAKVKKALVRKTEKSAQKPVARR